MAEEILLKTALKQRQLTLNIVLNNTCIHHWGGGIFFLQVSLKLFKLSQRGKQKFLGLNDINLNSVSLAFLKQHSNLLTKYINLSAATIGPA